MLRKKRVLYLRTDISGVHLKLLYPSCTLVEIRTPSGGVAYGVIFPELKYNSTFYYGLFAPTGISYEYT